MKIGQLIKLERQKSNIRQDELALGICSPSYLSKIENGTAIPGDEVQQLLLQRLNIPSESVFIHTSPELLIQFKKSFKEVINQRDKLAAIELRQDIRSFLAENILYPHKVTLLLMETRLQLMSSSDVKENISLLVPMQGDMSHTQLFHLYIIQGIIAYKESRFANALYIFTDTYTLTKKHRMEDWEMAELHYVLSLAAISDYRHILAIDHAQEALSYFNAKMQAVRSIECLLILGNAQKHTGNLNDALLSFEHAKEIMTTSGFSNYLGMIEHNLGACYSLLKESERALRHFNQSLLENENPDSQIVTILSLVKEHKKKGDKEQAKTLISKGTSLLNLLTEQNKKLYSHYFAIYKALLYDEDDLIPTFESALHYFEVKQNYYRCFVYCNVLADKLTNTNQFKLATTFYQKAFDYHLKHRKVQHWEELM